MPTADGSHTVHVEEMNVTYHSKHGAIQESMHVFIKSGFYCFIEQTPVQPVRIFEMGFGTGLNALLTLMEARKLDFKIQYTTVELFPLSATEIAGLNYADIFPDEGATLQRLHNEAWNKWVDITANFQLEKRNADLLQQQTDEQFDIIYYDAFAPSAQPQLWTEEVFKQLLSLLSPGGLLVTYCSKGDVRRAMQAAGFRVEKIPGPPGKREMVRAFR